MTSGWLGLEFSARRWAAWTCAALLAALQAHFFLQGYRLTGDEVLFESVVLDGSSLHYIAETALQQGRIGQFVLMPLLLFGSHFADYLWFRVAYVLMWYVDLLLFSIWMARIARARLALPLFVALVTLQSMIGYHMPPVGYPLVLGLPLLIVLATRLAAASEQTRERTPAAQWNVLALYLLYPFALISSEYMMITGVVLLLVEVGRRGVFQRPLQLRRLAGKYKREAMLLALVFLAYFWFRQSQSTHYDGASMDGLDHVRELLHTFALHVASATWLPFLDRESLESAIQPVALLAAALCAIALLLHWRSGRQVAPKTGGVHWLCSGLMLLGVVMITLPVVAARKQQLWCVVNHNCSYLDSRISLLFLLGAIALAALPLRRSRILRVSLGGILVLSLVLGNAVGYAISKQQAQGMRTAAAAWARAAAIACIDPPVPVAQAGQYIDPDHFIPMHAMMDRNAFWQAYMARVARESRCAGEPPGQPPFRISGLVAGEPLSVRLGEAGLHYLGSGWSHAEEGGVWSDGPDALIEARFSASAQPLRLLLQLQAYSPAADQPQRVDVKINGSQTTQWSVSADHAATYAVDIPPQLATSGGQLSVRLHIGQPTSPLQRHQSTDARLLGVLLTSLELQTR